jgi:hypothetical protein
MHQYVEVKFKSKPLRIELLYIDLHINNECSVCEKCDVRQIKTS